MNDGPSIIEYRDWSQRGHPTFRKHSCWGCQWLRVNEFYAGHFEGDCVHPAMIAEHKVPQHVSSGWKMFADSYACRVLRADPVRAELSWPASNDNDQEPLHALHARALGNFGKFPQFSDGLIENMEVSLQQDMDGYYFYDRVTGVKYYTEKEANK